MSLQSAWFAVHMSDRVADNDTEHGKAHRLLWTNITRLAQPGTKSPSVDAGVWAREEPVSSQVKSFA
jgi:hypothetical protein